MKKFIRSWGCLLFGTLIFVILVVAWKIFTRPLQPFEPLFSCRMTTEVSYFKAISPLFASLSLHTADVIVIGDSRTYSDIDPDVFGSFSDAKVFDFSTGQGSGGQLLYFLDRLQKIPPRKLIIVLSPLAIRSNAETVENNLRSQSKWVLFRKTLDQTLDHTLHTLRSYFVATINMQKFDDQGVFVRSREGYYACPFSGFGPRVNFSVKPDGSDAEYTNLLNKYSKNIKVILPILEEKIAVMKKSGWDIVCIRLPISKSLLAIEDSYLEKDTYASICKRTGVPYLDYSTDEFITHDGSHLGISEARKFSAKLAKDLVDSKFIPENKNKLTSYSEGKSVCKK